jgi:hypothetical protein
MTAILRGQIPIHRAAPSRILYGLLLIAACQTPLPWCHSHGSLAGTGTLDSSWMSTHLRTHHGAMDTIPQASLGWHWHLDYARLPAECPGQRSQDEPERLPGSSAGELLVTSIARTATEVTSFNAVDLVADAGVSYEASAARRWPAQFFSASAPTVPLSVRFCVARC